MKGAFTLIELLIAVIIVGIVASLALPQFTKTFESTRAKHAVAALGQIRSGERVYRIREGFYYPHFSDHPAKETNESTINDMLNIFLDTREENWKYEVDSNLANTFDAKAIRTSGRNLNEYITIDQDGTIDKSSNWSP